MDGEAVVCVPARDEAERLPRLLASLDVQTGLAARPGRRLRVVVVVNDSRDDTAGIARRMAERGLAFDLRVSDVTLPAGAAHVGTARRLAFDEGLAWLARDGVADGALLTTDADARVPPDWVAANLAALDGADIVGGRLAIDRDGPPDAARAALDATIARYWEAVRRIEDALDPPPHDPPPRHGDHTGASLALRAGLYAAVGGLPPLPRGEDNALVAAVTAAGGRLRHCPRVAVHVSDRLVGRAAGGMAEDMARRAGATPYLVPPPGHWTALIGRRAALRRAWLAGDGRPAIAGLRDEDHDAIGACPNDIAFVERASRRLEARDAPPAPVPVAEALAAFERLRLAA